MNSQDATFRPFRFHAVEQRSPKNILIDAKQRQSVEKITYLDKENLPDIGFLFFIITLSVVVILLIFRYSRFGKMMAEKTLTPDVFHKIPCRSCRYFAYNPYLNCAIHPSLVLTNQAIDCPDYCAKGENAETNHDVFFF